jgi:glycosyltransferase involved in cell wall biosynthesis
VAFLRLRSLTRLSRAIWYIARSCVDDSGLATRPSPSPVMHVVHVIPSVTPKNGGPSEAIVRMCRVLNANGVDTHVLTSDYDGPKQRLAGDSRSAIASRIGETTFKRVWFDLYTTAPGVIPWLLKRVRRYDIVHVHAVFSFTSTAAALIARLRRVPYVVRPLGTLAAYGLQSRRSFAKRISLAFVEGPMLRHAAAVHCTSEAERNDVLMVCPQAKTRVIPLSVVNFAVEADSRTRSSEPRAKSPIVLYLSRLSPNKNVHLLLEAFHIVTNRLVDARLSISGDGEQNYVDNLKRQVATLGIAEKVTWTGHVSGVDKAATFAAASVFVLPSSSENFGIAVAEALAAGLPCVLTPGVAIAARVEEVGAGIVAEPNATSIAAAIERYLSSRELRESASRAAKALAASDYSDQRMGNALVQMYREIAGSKS